MNAQHQHRSPAMTPSAMANCIVRDLQDIDPELPADLHAQITAAAEAAIHALRILDEVIR